MRFNIYRYNPEKDSKPYTQDYVLDDIEPGMMLLAALLKIKDEQDCYCPKNEIDLERPVCQNDLLRCLAASFNLDQEQIAEDAVDHEWDGEHGDLVLRQVGSEECIQAVRDNRDRQDDHD